MKPVVVITGATRGIGFNTAVFFAEQNWRVIGLGRDRDKLDQLRQTLTNHDPANSVYSCDVQEPDQVRNTVKAIMEKEGKIDVWINNAGIFYAIGPIWEVSAETWMQDVSVNLFGTFHCLQAVIPHMIEQGFGRIVNVTGGGTAGEFKYGSGYGVSKTAIARMTENAQAELQGTNVLVFAMGPGLNNTDMTRYQRASEAGQRYLAHIEQLFNNGKDVSPDKAPKLAWALANGRLDAYGGRIVSVSDDLEQLEKKAADLGANSRKLRISK